MTRARDELEMVDMGQREPFASVLIAPIAAAECPMELGETKSIVIADAANRPPISVEKRFKTYETFQSNPYENAMPKTYELGWLEMTLWGGIFAGSAAPSLGVWALGWLLLMLLLLVIIIDAGYAQAATQELGRTRWELERLEVLLARLEN